MYFYAWSDYHEVFLVVAMCNYHDGAVAGGPATGASATTRPDVLSLALVAAHQLPQETQQDQGLLGPPRMLSAMQSFIEATDWHAMVGKSVKYVTASLMTPDAAFPIMLPNIT